MSVSLIYTTISSKQEAKLMANMLLKEKLAACVNIVFSDSLYLWEGELKESEEVVMLVKTKQELTRPLVERIKELHSYECPAIMEFKTDSVDEHFLKWINSVTS